MVWAAESGGGFSLVEHPIPPRGLCTPLHRHTHEDEYTFVLEIISPGGFEPVLSQSSAAAARRSMPARYGLVRPSGRCFAEAGGGDGSRSDRVRRARR
jgi:hypothetical protein